MSAYDDSRPGCLAALGLALAQLFGDADRADRTPYRLTRHYLTPAELAFYGALQRATVGQAQINAKVRLADVLEVDTTHQYQRYFNRIAAKHFDFVLSHPETMVPLVAIELDDRSHLRADRRRRDEFVERACAAARLPLLRFPVRSGYDPREIEAKLAPYIGAAAADTATVSQVLATANQASVWEQLLVGTEAPEAPAAPPAPPAPRSVAAASASGAPATGAPACPYCGAAMVLRTANKGERRGERFWGCPNYPRCRGMRPYRPA